MPLPPVYTIESKFDPFELQGTIIPFVDPFSFDESDFRAEAPTPPSSINLNRSSFLKLRVSLATESTLANLAAAAYPRFQGSEPYLGPSVFHAEAAYSQFEDFEPNYVLSVVQPAAAYPQFQDLESFLGPSFVQHAAIDPGTQSEVPTAVLQRGRLTPDQAIYIFTQKKTKKRVQQRCSRPRKA